VLRSLDVGGMSPITLEVHEPSLDDVFLALTGRHADAEEPAEVASEGRRGRRRRRRAA
jgi:hypothetical protein